MKKLILFWIIAIALISSVYANPSTPTLIYPANNSAFEIASYGTAYVIPNATIIATDSTHDDFFCGATNSDIGNNGVTLIWFVENNTVTEFPIIPLSIDNTPNHITINCFYDSENLSTYSGNITYDFTLTRYIYTAGDIPKSVLDTSTKLIIEIAHYIQLGIIVWLLFLGVIYIIKPLRKKFMKGI